MSSLPCDEVDRVSSDCPRDTPLILLFSKRPLPLLLGGDESESLAATPCSSGNKSKSLINAMIYKQVSNIQVETASYHHCQLERNLCVCDSKP